MQFLQQSRKLILLNHGTNSDIYLYGDRQKGVILKMVSTSCIKEIKHLNNQYRILSLLNHQNLIKILKYKESINLCSNGSNKQKFINKNVLVLEYAHHGSLLNLYKKIRPKISEARWIFAQLSQAVRYLHCNYIVHRDLKPENVLVSQKESQIQIQLADFGFATSTRISYKSNAYKGTKRGFMAPQIHNLLQKPQLQYDMYKADIFSLGVILFILVCARLPFQYATPQNQHYKLLIEQNYSDFWKMHHQSLLVLEECQHSNIQDFKNIFQQMVHFDANKRPTIQQIVECSWLKSKQEIIRGIPSELIN